MEGDACARSINRLKGGFEDFNAIASAGSTFVDNSFKGTESIWWDDLTATSTTNLYSCDFD